MFSLDKTCLKLALQPLISRKGFLTILRSKTTIKLLILKIPKQSSHQKILSDIHAGLRKVEEKGKHEHKRYKARAGNTVS